LFGRVTVHSTEAERVRATVRPLTTDNIASSDVNASLVDRHDDTTHVNYKVKWEDAEARCRRLEDKVRQLERETIKGLQEKIDRLQSDCDQMKVRSTYLFGHAPM
jgi:hypothetical protein